MFMGSCTHVTKRGCSFHFAHSVLKGISHFETNLVMKVLLYLVVVVVVVGGSSRSSIISSCSSSSSSSIL